MVATTHIEELKEYLSSLPLDIRSYDDGYEYKNPVLTLVDAVLSINRNYNNFVKPRLEIIKKSGIRSFTDLERELDKGDEYFMSFWNYRHPQRVVLLRNLLTYFRDFQQTNNIQGDVETLREWGNQSSVEKYKDWKIKGIAFTTYQYLRMLCGADTVKPDIHILRVVEEGIGRKVNPMNSVILIEHISKEMGIEARSLDHAIWQYSSSKRSK
ncbi:MAG: hypothetical protein XD93_0644 [candidate division WS6 bacterium 34_10]|uniref:Uncharacterized protein n=1 Tax=candidate division WS6 bacterium 34_10 TaxID=1641389 RepID=A0A101HHE2_9BACT|nr:MAG: hypothetical protein XD93_0644 [candidate division WS6 bacterium 34_10]